MPAGTGWTRGEQLIALRLYMRTPFGRLHAKNPEIISLAGHLGRTPGALAMKAGDVATDRRPTRPGSGGPPAFGGSLPEPWRLGLFPHPV